MTFKVFFLYDSSSLVSLFDLLPARLDGLSKVSSSEEPTFSIFFFFCLIILAYEEEELLLGFGFDVLLELESQCCFVGVNLLVLSPEALRGV